MRPGHCKEADGPLAVARGLGVSTPSGRPLVRDLDFAMGREKVAMIGRNGVGKSTLLEVLAGERDAAAGHLEVFGRVALVRQRLDDVPREQPGHLSLGELRKLGLAAAKRARADLVILDEPTRDLDARGVAWLQAWLANSDAGFIVASHDRRLLGQFENFVRVTEAGCRHFVGSLAEIEQVFEREDAAEEVRYLRNLSALDERERKSDAIARRWERKKNRGRVNEIDRAPARVMLNAKRSYAQEKQGKRGKIRRQRIAAAREWAESSRAALTAALPLRALLPTLPASDGRPIVSLAAVSVRVGRRVLFDGLDLELARQRVAVVGPNGSGKTTLLEVARGERLPTTGSARQLSARLGAIGQGAREWLGDESLLSRLQWLDGDCSPQSLAELLIAHRFPLALAERSLSSLSPGERLRAALICLTRRSPPIELLILDEPTDSLDFTGAAALRAVLSEWRGGLLIASHDLDFLEAIAIDRVIELGGGYEVRE